MLLCIGKEAKNKTSSAENFKEKKLIYFNQNIKIIKII